MAEIRLSKSRYTKGIQCPKMLWMDRNMPGEFDDSVLNEAVLETGSLVGDIAMSYFGDFVEVPFDPTDFAGMASLTTELIRDDCPTICEATFATGGNLCMVDILRVEHNGVHVVEVKSTTHVKGIHKHDMAYQVWLLGECGINVKSISLMRLNGHYVRHGDIDLRELFVVEDHTDEVWRILAEVPDNVAAMRAVASQDSEPEISIGHHCKDPYECGYRKWCWRSLPSPSVFDLNRIRMDKALRLMDEGITTPAKAYDANVLASPRQLVQAECEARNLRERIDHDKLGAFLETLSYPLYFLDFETWQSAIPPFDGTRPYQQIPTQYSLHIVDSPDGELRHLEFLAETGSDPRRAIAERLVADIPEDSCTLAYSMSFERNRIRELAAAFPDLARHLMSIHDNMADLLIPFGKGWYYNRAMGGSNSIKAVLPALFPNDPELDYHALEGVHNGAEAMGAFARLQDMEPAKAKRIRGQLLRYCELDTLAMVRIWQRLVEATGT